MGKFKNTHLWLLIPFAIAILGFMRSYWLQFADVPWRQHLHGLTATMWFVVLIAQPYLITRGHTSRHRLFGMFALFLAGGVVVSALGAIPYNLVNERMSDAGRYGLSFIDVVLIFGFSTAVFMAVKTAQNIEDHARWMISTVFWSILPGLFRLSFIPLAMIFGREIPVTPAQLIAGAGALNILVLSFLMYRDRRAHPAYLSVAIASLVFFLPETVSQMQWWRDIADALFTI